MPRAAVYARISSDPTGNAAGVNRQLEDCRDLCARRGWDSPAEYVDDDRSAYSGRRRPEYERLLGDVKDGLVDAVVVWHLDRLHRQPRELETFFEVCDAAGVKDLATVTGDVDLSTDDGRFMARILGAVSRKESDDKSRRLRRKHDQLAKDGKVSGGGTRPYGFNADRRTVRADEAVHVKEAARRVLAGDSVRSVCRDFTEREVLTVTGKAWTMTTMRRMLRSGRISGQREHRGEIVGPAEWPAIITPGETARLRAVLGDKSRQAARSPRRYLLAGLLRCQRCGATMVARPKADGRRGYVCAKGPGFSGCGGMAVLAEDLETLVVEGVLYRLDTPELAAALSGAAEGDALADAAQSELAEDQAQLEELASAFGDKLIGMSEWLAARKPIEQRIEVAKKQLSRSTRTTALDGFVGNADQLRAMWAELPLPRQAAVVKAILDHVVIAPAVRGRNQFDPNRVTPIWRL